MKAVHAGRKWSCNMAQSLSDEDFSRIQVIRTNVHLTFPPFAQVRFLKVISLQAQLIELRTTNYDLESQHQKLQAGESL